MATSLGNLSGKLGITTTIAAVPIGTDKARTPGLYIDNNTWYTAEGRVKRFNSATEIAADANLTAAEAAAATQYFTDGIAQIIVIAKATADASVAAALDDARDQDDDWYYASDALDDNTDDADKQSIGAWMDLTDSDERGAKFGVTQHDTATQGTTPYAGGTADVSAANATNAWERYLVIWLDDPTGMADGIAAASAVANFAKHDRQQPGGAPSWGFLPTSMVGDTFDGTEEVNALTYTGTSLIAANIHGQSGQLWPGKTGSNHAGETIQAADFVWFDVTARWALNIYRQAQQGRKAYPFTDAGFAAMLADALEEIRSNVARGWVAPDVPHDDDGTGGTPIVGSFTRLADLGAAAVAAQQAQLTWSYYSLVGAREISATQYVQQPGS